MTAPSPPTERNGISAGTTDGVLKEQREKSVFHRCKGTSIKKATPFGVAFVGLVGIPAMEGEG